MKFHFTIYSSLLMTILSLFGSTQLFAQAASDEGAFLDGKYTHLIHPKVLKSHQKSLDKSDTLAVISRQSSVKSQEARGTCSIFSATAYLESQLIANQQFSNDVNLSEEWLEYLAVRNKSSDGSSAPFNFNAFFRYGMTTEEAMPYIGEDWTEVYNPLKVTRCGHITENYSRTSCYLGHYDPKMIEMKDEEIISKFNDVNFVQARKLAREIKEKNLKPTHNGSYYLNDTNEIKNILTQGKPVILEIDFYYGAWNHRKADEYGIGRDLDHWSKGIVTSPEEGSMDLEKSSQHPAGHSILVVGFDDNKIVTKTIKMTDGTLKTFTYKGVYYFKNSWGTFGFGAQFELEGLPFPGYGMIVQKHAHEQGAFFQLPL